MKKALILFGIIAIVALFGFSACGDSGGKDSGDPTVYIAGSYYRDGIGKACYWVNGEFHALHAEVSATEHCLALSIFVEGGNVYLAGYTFDGSVFKACYWKNGSFTDISGGESSSGDSIFASGGKLYISGFYEDGGDRKACYWTVDNGIPAKTPIVIPGDPGYSWAKSIFIANNKVYTVGYCNNELSEPFYTENGTVKALDLNSGVDSRAVSIFVSGTDVYTAGYIDGRACYWINEEPPTYIGPVGSYAESIVIAGGIPYISGYYEVSSVETACYWKDKERKELEKPEGTYSSANSIAVSGANVYVAGNITNKGCYWVNGKLRELKVPAGTEGYVAFSIAVK